MYLPKNAVITKMRSVSRFYSMHLNPNGMLSRVSKSAEVRKHPVVCCEPGASAFRLIKSTVEPVAGSLADIALAGTRG